MPRLADFLAALDRRLHGLGPEGVSIALRRAAGRLSPSERPAFLAMFDPAPAAPADGLVAEIEALVNGHGHAEDDFAIASVSPHGPQRRRLANAQ